MSSDDQQNSKLLLTAFLPKRQIEKNIDKDLIILPHIMKTFRTNKRKCIMYHLPLFPRMVRLFKKKFSKIDINLAKS